MTDHFIAVFAGFVAGLLTGWCSLAVIAVLVVSGRIFDSEE
jgi:hypothetical protein